MRTDEMDKGLISPEAPMTPSIDNITGKSPLDYLRKAKINQLSIMENADEPRPIENQIMEKEREIRAAKENAISKGDT